MIIRIRFVVLILIVLYSSCKKKEQMPIADFTFTNNQEGPASVNFTNNSEFSEKYLWDFGDGNLSREENPTNYFKLPGNYNVNLQATNSAGTTEKGKIVTIRGTTFAVKNSCLNTVNAVFASYLDGDSIHTWYFGRLLRGEQTA